MEVVLLMLPLAVQGVSYSLSNSAFFLFSHSSASSNNSDRVIFLQDGCSTVDQQLSTSLGGVSQTVRLISALPSLHCAVTVQVVNTVIRLDRPYIDVIALSDISLLSHFRRRLCVSVRLASPTAATINATCELSPFEEDRHSCLIRIQIPYSWFGQIGGNQTRQAISLSHTVGATCSEPFFDRPQHPIVLLSSVENAQTHTVVQSPELSVSVLSRSNLSLSLSSLNSLFVHLALNHSDTALDSFELRLWLDARVDIVNVSPLSSDDWSIRATTPNLYTSFMCTKKNKTLTNWDGYLFALLLRMKGSVMEKQRLERQEEAEASIHWELRVGEGDDPEKMNPVHRSVIKLRVTPDIVYAVVPIAKTRELANVAVLSGVQASSPMRVLTVSLGGVTKDVTALSHCMSAESRILKTSPTCASVYMDGSEMRGQSAIKVHVHYENWVTDITFSVWYPRLPVTVWVRDPVLNAVSSWPIAIWKFLEVRDRKGRSTARQVSCKERYQQTEVRILASFQVIDDRMNEKRYLSGARDVLFDVTSLTADRIQTADRSIAIVRRHEEKVIVMALRTGSTNILVKSAIPQLILGSAALLVTDDAVAVRDVSITPLTRVDIHIEPVLGRRSSYHVLPSIVHRFNHRYQHGSLSIQVHYTDGQTDVLSDIPPTDYSILLTSSDERALAVTVKDDWTPDLIALEDVPDLSVLFELRPPEHCVDPDALPLVAEGVPMALAFPHDMRPLYPLPNVSSPSYPPSDSSGWRMDTLLAVLLIVVVVVIAFRVISARARSFSGYEKLVVPLISRLSISTSGGGKDEDTNEWVWLSKTRNHSNSIGSRYSQKSTMQAQEESPSYECNTHTSISYRGSEISVFIAPQPQVTVNGSMADRESWKAHKVQRGRARSVKHPLTDSSSEQDLARSQHDPRDLPYHTTHTWNTKRSNNYYDGLRESVA